MTEGKRAKRSKKQNDSVNGDRSNSPNGDDEGDLIQAPEKKAHNEVDNEDDHFLRFVT